MRELAALGAHVHLYGVFRRLRPSDGWLVESPEVEAGYRALAGGGHLLHVHAPIAPGRFVAEWSRYDAGLLHVPDPADRFRTLNFPNRHTAYVAAGLPVALAAGTMPAMQRHLEGHGAALVYRDAADLVHRLPEPTVAARALAARESVTFEVAFPALLSFIQSCLPATA